MSEQTTIFLIPEQAKRFMIFQQYYEPISKMLDVGVFSQRNATLRMYFDHEGTLQTISRDDILYKRLSTD